MYNDLALKVVTDSQLHICVVSGTLFVPEDYVYQYLNPRIPKESDKNRIRKA